MNTQCKIIFFGTPEFAVPTLKALHKEGYNVVLVVTQPDKPVGRKHVLTPSEVKVEAEKMGIEVCDENENLKLKIENLKPEVGVVVAYGKIIPKEVLNLFSMGCLNIHPSLLPKYRGPSPIQAAILNGDKETGITIIKLDEKMDHGDHVACSMYHVACIDTYKSLSEKLALEGAKLLIKTLPDYLSGKIKPVPQDDSQATFTKILKREDGKIDWHKSAIEIERQVRAYYPWPGSYSEFGIRLSTRFARSSSVENSKFVLIKILSARVSPIRLEEGLSLRPGKFYVKDGQLYIQCGQGALIIDKLQPEGRKEMTGKEFINGYL